MTPLTDLDLLSGAPIPLEGVGTLLPPRLRDLCPGGRIGFSRYNRLLSLACMGTEDFLQGLGLKEAFSALPQGERESFTPYNLLTLFEEYRELLGELLGLFLAEEVRYDEDASRFVTLAPDGTAAGRVDNENYPQVQRAILRLNCLSAQEPSAQNFKSGRARAVYEKILEGRKRQAKCLKPDDSLSLPNLVSAVACQHASYNLLNIWDLTVYQLYDQFARLNRKHQLDVSSLRWAAWGKDSFDFSLWYQAPEQKQT